MIVSDETVSLALAVLNDGERAFRVHFDAGMAEVEAEEAYANAFKLTQDGTIAEREAKATLSNSYTAARRKEVLDRAELKRHQAEVVAATKTIDVWQTENANARAAERVR